MRFLTFKRFIFYGFPIYLVAVEYGIRFLLSYAPGKAEDLALVGLTSTVTAAGLSLIAPVLIPKPLPMAAATAQTVAQNKAVVIGIGDQRLIACAYLALLLLPFLWGWALWLAHMEKKALDLTIFDVPLPGPFLLALSIYAIGMIFTEVKEVV